MGRSKQNVGMWTSVTLVCHRKRIDCMIHCSTSRTQNVNADVPISLPHATNLWWSSSFLLSIGLLVKSQPGFLVLRLRERCQELSCDVCGVRDMVQKQGAIALAYPT